ncbi:IclR family transcriptional regulator [Azospirillum doebereinerae]|uniref:IclR family transcriptional regulator n=1 Tax=Azospirillum doebereinerae TaxID=92933 RepID=A0A3S0VEB7_9PROT|nr:IclR family transcriptional regulator [Azospirillum doebereinerae]RUQ63083.1 IclR family transcriptional regulator [Azospirillum doebereinerae]
MTHNRKSAGTSTLDLALRALEFLANESHPLPLAHIANAMSASKATIYRHLVTLQRYGLVSQDPDTGRYDVGVKLLILGEAVRARFDVVSVARGELIRLRDATGQAVTICRMVDGELIVLDLIQGRTVIEFGTRPGTCLDLHASAHGKVWLAFGPPALLQKTLATPMRRWAPNTIAGGLREEVALVRQRGWAVAADEMITAVNALAAPVFDHRNHIAGSIAIVGATQFIPSPPDAMQLEKVLAAAQAISRGLGWRSSR